MKSWFKITAKAESAEIEIFDEIGFYGISGLEFVRQFQAIESPDVTLLINSPGGSVYDALLMFNAMKASGKNITVKVMAIAASAASYIAMVGNKIVMPENTFMFVHNPISGVYGNADDMREAADMLDKIGGSLMNTFSTRTGKDIAALQPLFKAESYLTAAECLALGLCDEVTPAVEVKALYETDRGDMPAHIQALLKPKAVETPKPTAEQTLVEQVQAMAIEMGLGDYAAVFAMDEKLNDLQAVKAAMRTAAEVKALCGVAALPDEASALITARTTLPEARKHLTAKMAEATDAKHTSNIRKPAASAPASNAGGSKKSKDVWAEIHALERGETITGAKA